MIFTTTKYVRWWCCRWGL